MTCVHNTFKTEMNEYASSTVRASGGGEDFPERSKGARM